MSYLLVWWGWLNNPSAVITGQWLFVFSVSKLSSLEDAISVHQKPPARSNTWKPPIRHSHHSEAASSAHIIYFSNQQSYFILGCLNQRLRYLNWKPTITMGGRIAWNWGLGSWESGLSLTARNHVLQIQTITRWWKLGYLVRVSIEWEC